jgi:hypothetical protein
MLNEHQKQVRKEYYKKMNAIMNIPEIRETYRKEFIDRCMMDGDCMRLDNKVFSNSRPKFYGVTAAVVSYKMFLGEVPRGMWVLHHCDNGWCVNPEHLYLGTKQDNHLDIVMRQRSIRKLTIEQVEAMRAEYDALGNKRGRQTTLARKYGVSHPTARLICLGERRVTIDPRVEE